jgi:hypothetical protein
MLGIALRPIVLALGILRPVEGKTVANQPIGNVDADAPAVFIHGVSTLCLLHEH